MRFPVDHAPSKPELHGASVVIWTTTPWTMPGNRAIADGADFDYAVFRVDAVEPKARRARVGEKLVVALELLPQVVKDVGIATHHVVHVLKGADLAGTVCAHPLRGRGYDFDVPVLLGDFVTTEAGTGFVHIAPGARRGRLRARPRARPGGPRDGRRRRHLQRLGAAVRRPARLQGRTTRSPPRSMRPAACWRAASWCTPTRTPGAPRRR